jgi:hypothetical protein
MRVRYHRGDVVAKLMRDARPTITIGQVVTRSGCSRGTVNGFLNNTKRTEPDMVRAIANVFNMRPEHLDDEVKRLNQDAVSVVPLTPRTEKSRQEDKDPVLDEAVQFGHRIGHLPLAARSAIYAIVAAIEEAYRTK